MRITTDHDTLLTARMASVLEDERKRLDMTREAFAARCGLTSAVYNDLLDGRTDPPLSLVTRIAARVGLSAAELLGEERGGFAQEAQRNLAGQAAILAALANPHRLKILMLMRAGHRTLGDIAPALTLPRNGVFQHMALLEASGLVVKRRDGGRVFYDIRSADVCAFLTRVLAAASGCPAPDREVRP